MKKLLLSLTFVLLFASCSKDEEYVSPIIGTFEGTVDFGNGIVANTLAIIEENGTASWDIIGLQ